MSYPNIEKLGIMIHPYPSPHILTEDVHSALSHLGFSTSKLDDLLGSQTVLLAEGRSGLYPHDVESILSRLLNNKTSTSQLLFD